MRHWYVLASLCLAVGLAGCVAAGNQKNPYCEDRMPETSAAETGYPLCDGGHTSVKPAYRLSDIQDGTDSNYLILFAFSGGGKRSAAFAYGALQAAAALPMDGGATTLARQIDVVSGVSGGSFTAAAFALYGQNLLQPGADGKRSEPPAPYETFLDSNTMAGLFDIYLNPARWRWMFHSDTGSNDEMEQTYRNSLLRGATFGDLAALERPYLVVQATDLDSHQPFTFTQNDFDMLCSDLSHVELARAVAASNGFPILFSPIGMQMFTQGRREQASLPHPNVCPDMPWLYPKDVDASGHNRDDGAFSPEQMMRSLADQYIVPETAQSKPFYIHLVDGGLSDNLALRGPMSLWTRLKMQIKACKDKPGPADCDTIDAAAMHLKEVHYILVVSVDGESEPQPHQGATVPVLSGLGRIGGAVFNSVIDSSNLNTLPVARAAILDMRDAIREQQCPQNNDASCGPKAVFAHVALTDWAKAHADPKTPDGQSVADLPTGLSLPPGAASSLVEAGKQALSENQDIRCFLELSATGNCAVPDK